MRLFEYECDAVVVLDINNALLFSGSEWRPAGVYIARGSRALFDIGSRLFRRALPMLGRSIFLSYSP